MHMKILVHFITSSLFLIVAAMGLFFPAFAIAQEENGQCVSTYENGIINWSTGKVSAKGKASPDKNGTVESPDSVLGAARADASCNLISVLKNIQFNGEQSVGEYIASNETTMAGIEKNAMDAVVVEQHYTSDRAMEVTLETSIFGGFLQLVLPDDIGEIPKIESIKTNLKNVEKQREEKKPFTGLIIDAGGMDFHPVLYPVIVSELGDILYSSAFISRDFAVQHGICSYVCNMQTQIAEDRIGSNPIFIKALRKGGEKNSSIVISKSDAEKIEKVSEYYILARECRVVILLDQ